MLHFLFDSFNLLKLFRTRQERIAARQSVVLAKGKAALDHRKECVLNTDSYHQVEIGTHKKQMQTKGNIKSLTRRGFLMKVCSTQGLQMQQEERLFKQNLKELEASRSFLAGKSFFEKHYDLLSLLQDASRGEKEDV